MEWEKASSVRRRLTIGEQKVNDPFFLRADGWVLASGSTVVPHWVERTSQPKSGQQLRASFAVVSQFEMPAIGEGVLRAFCQCYAQLPCQVLGTIAMRKRVGRMIKGWSVVGVSVLGTLFLLEAGLRLYSLFIYPKMTEFDSRLGWKHAVNRRKVFRDSLGQENAVVHNSYGHRGQPYGYRKARGKFRVLILGDSFADGQVNEEDLFSARLEKECPRLEAINAAVSGYGTVQEYLYLRSEGLNFDPDMVMVLFFENDLTDNCLSYFPSFGPRPYANFANGKLEIDETLDPTGFDKFALPAPFRMTLQRWSYLYYFLNTRIYQRVFSEKLVHAHYADLRDIADSEKYNVFTELINKMKNELALRGIQFLLVLAPTREDVHRETSETITRLVAMCRVRQIQYLSLLDRLVQENRRPQKLYYPVDIHWTRYGHYIAADEVGKYLEHFCAPVGTAPSSN